MSERKWFVRCEKGCLAEGMTKEQILTAIEQTITTGTIEDVDTGFVTKIKEQNKGAALSFWVGTQAEYNAIESKAENCFYIISDDETKNDIETALEGMREAVEGVSEKQALCGTTLFDDYDGIYAGETIQFNATKHNLFAVTVDISAAGKCTVFCGKTVDLLGNIHIDGANVATHYDDLAPIYARVSIAVDSASNMHTVKVAQYGNNGTFASEAGAFKITKIIGIV